MNLGLTEDQKLLTDSFRRFFETESSMARVRAAEPLGFDRELWRGVAEMGALAMRLPGDDTFGLFDAALVLEEAGRHLASAPIAETMVVVRALSVLGVESALVEKASAGDAVLTLALHEPKADVAQFIPAGAVADAILFLSGDKVCLATRTGETVSPENHGHMPLASHVLAGKGALSSRVVAQGAAARDAFQAALEEWKVLTAAALAGVARRALDLAGDYARDRLQFGRPISSFQAIAHPLADRVADVTGAQMLVWWAICRVADKAADAAAFVSLAYWWAAKSSAEAVSRALHTFGGYGLTLEYDIQLYHRRAKALALIMGDPRDELLRAGRRFWTGETTSLPDAGPMAVEFGLGAEADAFEAETRAFFDKTLTPEWHAKSHYSYKGHDWDLYKKKGAAKLLYPTWPKEYGGRGLNGYGAAAQLEAWEDYGVTSHAQSVSNMVGHVLIRFGSESLKKKIMPRLMAGEVIMSLGYSEPSSGSDIFAAKTKAVRDGDDWIINGQKMFTSGANLASHVFLLARTNPDAPKHKGITMFLVPLDAPGVEIHPVHTFQDERTNATFYSDVRIPDENRISPVDGALDILAWALSLEQGGGGFVGPHRHVFEAAVEWARSATRDGKPAIQSDRVLERLAQVAAHVQLSYLIFWRSQWLLEEGFNDRAAGPMSKFFSSELYLRDAMDMLDLAAPDTLLRQKGGVGLIELRHRHSTVTTIYGGTSEVQRSQVAENTFAFPKSR